jgi:hypothetical protein
VKRCIIVADGPSAAGFVPPDDIPIIAVKGAIEWLSRADYWFSLDPNSRTKNFVNNPKPGTIYYCACADSIPLPEHVIRLKRFESPYEKPKPPVTTNPLRTRIVRMRQMRRVILPNGSTRIITDTIEDRQVQIAPQPQPSFLVRSRAILGLSTDPTGVNTGNSAYGALGLAFHLGFTHVLLVGVDGTQEKRVSDDHPPRGDLSHLPILFQSTLSQINLSTISVMEGIPQTTLENWLINTVNYEETQ